MCLLGNAIFPSSYHYIISRNLVKLLNKYTKIKFINNNHIIIKDSLNKISKLQRLKQKIILL